MARIIDVGQFIQQVSGIIHAPKQQAAPYLELTLKKLFRLKSAGTLDFGGSEFREAMGEPCLPVKQHPEDSYGWWELHEGYYLMQFNEGLELPVNQIALLEPHPRLLAAGSFHPTLTIRALQPEVKVPLWIPKIGLRIKQNARISRMLVFETESTH